MKQNLIYDKSLKNNVLENHKKFFSPKKFNRMKSLKFTFLLILAVSIFSSCKKSSDSLAESIPAQSQSVTHINIESLIKKSNYDIFKNTTVQRGINMAKAMLKDQSAVKLIEDFQKNPNALGITLNKDLFFFTKGSYYGLILPVDDAKQIKESFTKFGLEAATIKEEKGIYSFSQSTDLDVAWNKEKIMILIHQSALGNNSVQLSATKLLTLDKKESIVSSDKNFEKFLKDKQDISIYFSMGMYADLSSKMESLNQSAYTNPIDKQASQDMAQGLKKVADKFKGVSFGSFMSFENGKIVGHTQYYFETPEAETNMKNFIKETTATITEKYLQFIPQAPIISFMANIKGKGYSSLLTETGILKVLDNQMKDSGIDVKSLIESISGNVVCSLDALTLTAQNQNLSDMDAMLTMKDKTGKTKFNLSFMAELTPGNTLATTLDSLVAKQKTEGTIKKNGVGQYSIKSDDFQGFIGIKNNTFYFTTDAENVAKLDNPIGKSNYSDKVKGKNGYLYGDLRPLKKFVVDFYSQKAGVQGAQFKPLVEEGMSLVETVEGYTQPDMTNEYTVNFTNKNDNSLASIFKYLDSVLTKIGAAQGL